MSESSGRQSFRRRIVGEMQASLDPVTKDRLTLILLTGACLCGAFLLYRTSAGL
jgi:hypothetical protein